MSIVTWPNLTQFTNRILSAAQLRDYSDAVNQLLAESMASQALQHCYEFAPSSSYSSYQVAGDWYQYHQANTVFYRVYLKNESAIGTTYARFYYVDGAGAETAIGSEFSVYGSSWGLCTGTIDVSGLGLTVGQPYRLRLRIKGNNSSNAAVFGSLGTGRAAEHVGLGHASHFCQWGHVSSVRSQHLAVGADGTAQLCLPNQPADHVHQQLRYPDFW